jgi:hypothetical protein
MKFYRVHTTDDPAQSDTLFPTKKAREDFIKETWEDGDDVIRDEITIDGPLTKELVCRIYSLAIR